MNREIKIDLADTQNQRGGRQESGRQQRAGSERGQEASDWRSSRGNIGPPSPYEEDRRSQPRQMGPSRGGYHQSQMYYPPQQGYAPPSYGPPHQGYARRPPADDYYQRGHSGYESDYTAGGRGYDNSGYPMMRQASYSSQYSGYASDREASGGMAGQYRGAPAAGYYGSIRRQYRGEQFFHDIHKYFHKMPELQFIF